LGGVFNGAARQFFVNCRRPATTPEFGEQLMALLLPQQRLLLELLIMSGDIALADDIEGTILERTVGECERKAWVDLKRFGAGYNKLSVTDAGRRALELSAK
tara:strand:+ start:145 stop:450 length:306 start_codon:yes stop_codon:yes gene_type:complete